MYVDYYLPVTSVTQSLLKPKIDSLCTDPPPLRFGWRNFTEVNLAFLG